MRPRSDEPLAVIPVRSGILPVGAAEAICEAGGTCLVVGTGGEKAVASSAAWLIDKLYSIDSAELDAALIAAAVAPFCPGAANVILPLSPDGRDLAPHLATALGRPLVAGATEVSAGRAIVARHGGSTMDELALAGPVVATLLPGTRSVPTAPLIPDIADGEPSPPTQAVDLRYRPGTDGGDGVDEVERSVDAGTVTLIAEIDADPATMDLADAGRIVAGGAGLGTSEECDRLHQIAASLGASVGATRVVTDWGWIEADRQIGTTGVTVDPELYLAVGISGAVQHTAGLGSPDHVIVVNTDSSCPMMDLADVGFVCDGPAFVAELADALSRRSGGPGDRPG